MAQFAKSALGQEVTSQDVVQVLDSDEGAEALLRAGLQTSRSPARGDPEEDEEPEPTLGFASLVPEAVSSKRKRVKGKPRKTEKATTGLMKALRKGKREACVEMCKEMVSRSELPGCVSLCILA